MLTEEDLRRRTAAAVERAKAQNPLAGSITNFVTVDFVANAQLAVGGSAAMVYLPDEGEALAAAGESMYINVGTLLPIYEKTVPATMKRLHELKRPWVLDPVAVGIGELRTSLLQKAKDYKPTVIRGNASEIIALARLWNLTDGTEGSHVRGVDSTDTVQASKSAAVALAAYTGGAVAVSGAEDLVTDGIHLARCRGGSPMMERITGCGCSLGGVIAVYAAVTDPFTSAFCGTQAYNLAGKKAAATATGPASFKGRFIDGLYNLGADDMAVSDFIWEVL